eukprot:scaffold13860_cov106-Skeletonema_dohrnii-CCMP3373.AAC.3
MPMPGCAMNDQHAVGSELPRLRLFYEGFSTSTSFIRRHRPALSRQHTLKHPHQHQHQHQQACGCMQVKTGLIVSARHLIHTSICRHRQQACGCRLGRANKICISHLLLL